MDFLTQTQTQVQRLPLWLRWLGWTALFALVCLATTLLGPTLQSVGAPVPFPLFLAPPLIGAFLIGARFRSWWWVLGSPAPTLAFLVLVSSQDPNAGIALGWLIFPLVTASVALSVLAFFGVWWGIQREENDF